MGLFGAFSAPPKDLKAKKHLEHLGPCGKDRRRGSGMRLIRATRGVRGIPGPQYPQIPLSTWPCGHLAHLWPHLGPVAKKSQPHEPGQMVPGPSHSVPAPLGSDMCPHPNPVHHHQRHQGHLAASLFLWSGPQGWGQRELRTVAVPKVVKDLKPSRPPQYLLQGVL